MITNVSQREGEATRGEGGGEAVHCPLVNFYPGCFRFAHMMFYVLMLSLSRFSRCGDVVCGMWYVVDIRYRI